LGTILLTHRPSFLCNIYEANNSEDAEIAIRQRFYTLLGITEANGLSEFIMTWIFTTGALDRVYLPAGHELRVTQEEIDVYAGWTNDDCSGCSPIDVSCLPQTGTVNKGTPSPGPFDGGIWSVDIGTWYTITSADVVGYEEITLNMDNLYEFEIEVLDATTDLTIYLRDCAGTPLLHDHNPAGSLPAMPYNIGNHQFVQLDMDSFGGAQFQMRLRRVS
jgi:hypothetical protein